MENSSYNSPTLQLEGLKFVDESTLLFFFLFLFSYIIFMLANLGILLIVLQEKLHRPMYVLLCNLSVSDIIGITHILPRLLSDMLLPPSQRLISYYECVVQAFVTQMFGSASHTVLMAMAFDRYVAICRPLSYGAVMSRGTVAKLIGLSWGVPGVLVGVLIGLTVRLNRCRTLVANPYCDNASLFKLSCESVVVNNIYGLAYTVLLFVASVGCILLTYGRIAAVCLAARNKSLNSKALKTCSTHLVVYLIMSISGYTIILLHRFPQYSEYRKLSAILFVIVPGSLNPVIYGLQSKDIRSFLQKLFSSGKCLPSR